MNDLPRSFADLKQAKLLGEALAGEVMIKMAASNGLLLNETYIFLCFI